MSPENIKIIASDKSWIEGAAIQQLQYVAQLQGIVRAVGLPDLHPGKGIPIGAAFESQDIVYPHLVGNDIGCGMGLWQTDMSVRKFKLDKSVKKLTGFEQVWDGDTDTVLSQAGLPTDIAPMALGTIGSGNHFAEFQKIEKVFDETLFAKQGLDIRQLHLLVHSGSRGLGETILRRHVDVYKSEGLSTDSTDCEAYLHAHNQAMAWAVVNRQVIAKRFLEALGLHGDILLDICHNSVTPYGDNFVHRKGAAPSDKGLVVIPGSRGTLTYLVQPIAETAHETLHSLAHGAGRKWKRSEAKGKLQNRYKITDLARTKLGGRVICEDKALMYEEAPEAYKDVETVISDLQDMGYIKTVASLRPLITYKTRRR